MVEVFFTTKIMIDLILTDSQHSDFKLLVKQLDQYLAIVDGDDHAFYDQFNQIDSLQHVVIAYEQKIPIGCGAFKPYDANTVEIKRMYTVREGRGKGVATAVLQELERWAGELRYTSCILETGKKQIEAIVLYKRRGYELIPNYGQYADVENSVCFQKTVR